MSIELYPSVAKIKRNGVYENLPGFVPETGSVATQQMIATAESSNVAQYAHNKGEYFRLNDTLYQAIVRINVGDNIVVGTNCQVTVIGNDLSNIANSIANYELGIATGSHNIGDYFFVNDVLYVATDNIQQGDSISTSTNCRLAVVGDELIGLKTALAAQSDRISELITKPKYHNLFDPFDENVNTDKYFVYNTGALEYSNVMGCVKIELDTSKTYSLLGATTFFGSSNVIKIPCFSSQTGERIGTKWGTLDSTTNIVTITELTGITRDPTVIIGYSFRLSDAYKSFVIEGTLTELPKMEDLYEIKTDNPLCGKEALFFGDSICHATSVPREDTDFYNWGWAGRVGYYNYMKWLNNGSSGASITNMSGRTCIATIVNETIVEHPNAEYIILEGGTNDADVIAQGGDYTIGTYDDDDYTSTYDMTTFCGSFETLLRTVIKAYPNGKIGYIVAQKMGQSSGALENRRELFQIAKEICQKWGVTFIDLWSGCQMNPMLTEYYDSSLTLDENIASKYYCDGQHLTDKGYDLISPLIEGWMKAM